MSNFLDVHLQVRRAAELDIAQAKVWYETQRPGLGAQLQAEISHVFSILEETPSIYPVVYRNVRRAIVHRFPYLIWYRIIDKQVIVLACSTQGRVLKSRGLVCANRLKMRPDGPRNFVTL